MQTLHESTTKLANGQWLLVRAEVIGAAVEVDIAIDDERATVEGKSDFLEEEITGRGGLQGLVAAVKILRNEIIPAAQALGLNVVCVPSDDRRASAYRRLTKLGFLPFCEIFPQGSFVARCDGVAYILEN